MHGRHPLPLQSAQSQGPADKEATAGANRLAFGRTKAEKQQAKAEKALSDKKIDAHKRDS